jgi:hypothetical protein
MGFGSQQQPLADSSGSPQKCRFGPVCDPLSSTNQRSETIIFFFKSVRMRYPAITRSENALTIEKQFIDDVEVFIKVATADTKRQQTP